MLLDVGMRHGDNTNSPLLQQFGLGSKRMDVSLDVDPFKAPTCLVPYDFTTVIFNAQHPFLWLLALLTSQAN